MRCLDAYELLVTDKSGSALGYILEHFLVRITSLTLSSSPSEVAELKEKQTSSINELKAEYTLEIAHEKEKV